MKHKIAIIGAGMAGLTAANQLKHQSKVTLFDKSRGMGGRMSTRYAEPYEFDHGAQYFTCKTNKFRGAVLEAISAGHAAPWMGRARYLKEDGLVQDTGADRFVSIPRMNSWAKAMGENLDIRLDAKIVKIGRDDAHWVLSFEGGAREGGFTHVILAVPAPQAIALLPANAREFSRAHAAKMRACFALMVGLESLPDLGWETLRSHYPQAAWIAVNSAKPGRPDGSAPCLVIHSGPDWSDAYAEASRDWVQAQMEAASSKLCGIDISAAPHRVLHRWLYASGGLESESAAAPYDPMMKIGLCGDWLKGGRVEGAYLSGVETAEAVLKNL